MELINSPFIKIKPINNGKEQAGHLSLPEVFHKLFSIFYNTGVELSELLSLWNTTNWVDKHSAVVWWWWRTEKNMAQVRDLSHSVYRKVISQLGIFIITLL